MKRSIYSTSLALVSNLVLLASAGSAEDDELGRIDTAESVAAAARHEQKEDQSRCESQY